MRAWPALLFVSVPLLGQGKKTHGEFRDEATAAYQRKDFDEAKNATLAALALRPDSPQYLHNLAALSALMNDPATALNALRQIAALGVAPNIERDPDLASLQGTPEFIKILHAFTANRVPQGEAELVAELPGRTGIIEGIAFRERTGDVFLADVHHRCVWRRDRDGNVARFTAEDDELLGMFGVALDESRNTLWVAMSAVPEMSGYLPEMKGHAALAEFNLGTSELRRVIPVPDDGRDHGFSDLVIAPDGTVYLSDYKAPVIWMFDRESEELQKVVDSPALGSLQGLILEKRTLLAADYDNGLVAIDLATGNITALAPPKNITLVGLDGMVTVPGGIVAIQNGVEPQRVIRVTLSPDLDAITRVDVLASALPHVTDLGLVTLVNDRPTFVAGAGWDHLAPANARVAPASARTPSAHGVRIFQVTLP